MCSLPKSILSDIESLPVERLEREITELAAHIYAATCRWLCLVAEFERRGGWEPWGCKSCADWLAWRCSLTSGAAREQLRVARRLTELSEVREAFASGELSYSKVRAISRVATAENESYLLMLARHATASQLERLVRSYRGVVAYDLERANEAYRERELIWFWDDDGSLVIHGRLPAEDGALLVRALEAGRDELRECPAQEPSTDTRAAPESAARVPAPESVRVSAETWSDPGVGKPRLGADVDEITEGGVSAETSADPEVAGPRFGAVGGACDDAGVSAETSADPDVDGSRSGASVDDTVDAGVSAVTYSSVLARTVTEDEAPADRGGRRASNADALVLMAETLLATGAGQRVGGERYELVLHVDAPVLRDDAPDGRCELDDGPAFPPETARRLACDAGLVTILEREGRPLSVGRKTRTIPAPLRRALHSRDGGCRFPGCTQRRFVDAHHIHHWAHGGETKLSNLLLLCRHHHRLLHEDGYTVERHPGRGVTFRRPDGRPLQRTPKAQRGDHGELMARNHRQSPTIDPETCVPLSAEPFDYGMAVDGLLEADGLLG